MNHTLSSKENRPTAGQRRRNDLLLILALLLTLMAVGVGILFLRAPGATVTVTVNGEVYGQYPLSKDARVEIRHGEDYNLLEIREGKAYVSEANCPDGICAAHRPVFREGESVICLPHRVVIRVEGGAEDLSPDAIS